MKLTRKENKIISLIIMMKRGKFVAIQVNLEIEVSMQANDQWHQGGLNYPRKVISFLRHDKNKKIYYIKLKTVSNESLREYSSFSATSSSIF